MKNLKKQWKKELEKMDLKEIARHASVSTQNKHYCKECFCCFCYDYLKEIKKEYMIPR